MAAAKSILQSNLQVYDRIGDGSTADVYRGYWFSERIDVAVKKYTNSCRTNRRSEFQREIEILSRLKHENVISIFGYNLEKCNTYIVCELMLGGSLYDYIHNMDYRLNNVEMYPKLIKILNDIVDGMNFLHGEMVVHGDLKSSNILLTKDFTVAKIADFGLAKVIDSVFDTTTTTTSAKSARGTIRYMPPEIARGEDSCFKSDVWSFGCILLEAVTKDLPFRNLKDTQLFMLLQNDDTSICYTIQNEFCPRFFNKVISQCLTRKKEDRLSFSQIKSFAVKYRNRENQGEEIEKVRKENDMLKKDLTEERARIRGLETERKILEDDSESQKRMIEHLKKINEREKRLLENLNEEKMERDRRIRILEDTNNGLQLKLVQERAETKRVVLEKHNTEYYLQSKIHDLEKELKELSKKLKRLELQDFKTSTPARSLQSFNPLERSISAYEYLSPPSTPASVFLSPTNLPTGIIRTGKTHTSRGCANGREIFQGPQGGEFYLTASRSKQYVKK